MAAGPEDRPVSQQLPVCPADLVVAGYDAPRREGEYRIPFVQRDKPFHISGVRSLDKEFAQVLW